MDMVQVEAKLKQGLAQYDLSEAVLKQLINYLTLLIKWNKTYNLTAIRDPFEMVDLHLLDSLTVLSHVRASKAKTLLDVGAGAGLPSIPLAICLPELNVYAIDKVQKKTSFMQQVKAELGLSNFSVLNGRVETLKQTQFAGDGLEIIISRAFSDLNDFIALTQHLLASGGCWFAMKGVLPTEEIEALKQSGKYEIALHSLAIFQMNVERHLVDIKVAKQ